MSVNPTVSESIKTLVLASVGILTAFSITFAASETFRILFEHFPKWKKIFILWIYAAFIFIICVILFMYLPDSNGNHQEEFEKRTLLPLKIHLNKKLDK